MPSLLFVLPLSLLLLSLSLLYVCELLLLVCFCTIHIFLRRSLRWELHYFSQRSCPFSVFCFERLFLLFRLSAVSSAFSLGLVSSGYSRLPSLRLTAVSYYKFFVCFFFAVVGSWRLALSHSRGSRDHSSASKLFSWGVFHVVERKQQRGKGLYRVRRRTALTHTTLRPSSCSFSIVPLR